MANLKGLRNRLDAIKSTQKITSAMKMVAASKLRYAQDLLHSGESYKNNLYSTTGKILCSLKRQALEAQTTLVLPDICTNKGEDKDYLLIILSSDKGLCGSYNVNVVRKAVARIKELQNEQKSVKIICLGAKGYRILHKDYQDIMIDFGNYSGIENVNYIEAKKLGDAILQMYGNGKIDVCEIIYSQFVSAMNRDIISKQILPIDIEHLEQEISKDFVDDAYYNFEPSTQEALTMLLPMIFKEKIFEVMTNSQASEQGARMTSMDNATKNAKDITSKLNIKYNRIRQSMITTELTEIISGAEAL